MQDSLFNYVSYLGNKLSTLESDLIDLKSFKSEFIKKRSYKKKDFSNDLEPKILSLHFNKSYENMRALKSRYFKDKKDSSTWVLYCKAYYFDKLMEGKK